MVLARGGGLPELNGHCVDGAHTRVSRDDLAGAAPRERDHVRLDRVLPALLAKQVPSCVTVYGTLYEQFQDQRPLDERSRSVWGAAVIFFCVLDRLATGGEYEDPFATVEEMITWLAEGGEVPRDDVESARSALQGSNIPFQEEEVLNILLENRAGEVAMVAHKLAEAGLNLHAIYVLGLEGDLIELAIAVDNVKKAKKVLE